MKLWIISGLLLVILISSVYAACPAPDISTYNACTNGCPDAVKYTEKFATCVNNCLASWNKIQDAFYACQKTEEEQKVLDEQKLLAEQNKTKVSNIRGDVSITKADGTKKSVSANTELQDGDKLETGSESSATVEMPDADHKLTIGSESAITYHKKASIVDLLFGRLRMKILQRMVRPGETIVGAGIHAQITMPGTAAGADRGTDFIAEHYGSIGRFYVQEGIVDVTNNNNETFSVNAWEMITVYSNGTTFKSELSATNWYGLLNSIQVGVDFTPAFETTNAAEQETKATNSGERKTSMPTFQIAIAIGAVALIIVGALIIKKSKKK